MKKKTKMMLVIILMISSYCFGLNHGISKGVQNEKVKRVNKARWLAEAQAGDYRLNKQSKRERVYSKCRQQIETVSGIFVSSFELVKTLIDQ